MVGAWPIETDRLLPYMEKACREAKSMTNWLSPNAEFEAATKDFVEAVYQDRRFLSDLGAFVNRIKLPGQINALSQTLLKLTAPGIPDTYQGTELWDLSLVDPDNRRPVDYELRRKLLKEIDTLDVPQIWDRREEGLPKLWLIRQALRLRREHREAFGEKGSYAPLKAIGSKADHALAFQRGDNVAVVLTRLPVKLADNWGDTKVELRRGKWRNVLDGKTVNGGDTVLSELLNPLAVALLVRE